MSTPDFPTHHGRAFITKFERLGGRGFFPVHDGGIANEPPQENPLVAIFGTDWGPKERYVRCAQAVNRPEGCECQQALDRRGFLPTESRLFDFLEAASGRAGRHLSEVFLTNAVLALVEGEDRATGCVEVFRRHPDYLRECGKWHQEWLNCKKPGLVVVLGAAYLEVYGQDIWPQLFGPKVSADKRVWHGAKSLQEARRRQRVAAVRDLHVLLMPHPSAPRPWPPDGDVELFADEWKGAAARRGIAGPGRP